MAQVSGPEPGVRVPEAEGRLTASGAAETEFRFCPTCGRGIDRRASFCQHCARALDESVPPDVYHEPISAGKRVLLYLCSLLIPMFGIALGIIYTDKDDEEHKSVGMKCLILGAISLIFVPTVLAAVMYVMVLGM